MPVSFSVKNVPDRVAKTLRARARHNHRSLQGELLAILASATTEPALAGVRETAEPWGAESGAAKSHEFGHPLPVPALAIPTADLARLCRRWKVKELAFFGSVLRDDFRPDSDVDVLVAFTADADWSLFDFMDLQEDLTRLLRRKVDLVEKSAIERSRNVIRRQHILEHHMVIYAA
jgi:predicted nucleotidyltransferase/plasmid stability protein